MNSPHPPVDPSPPPAAAPAEELTETQAFTRAWVVFILLFAAVIGLLWANKAYFG